MTTPTDPVPQTVRSIREMAQKAWGKDWAKPEPGYEFSNGRKFDDSHGLYEGNGE
jgi:hypothetical protein